MIDEWTAGFDAHGIGPGTVCGIIGDYAPGTCSLMFTLMRANAIIVPLTSEVEQDIPRFIEIAGVTRLFSFEKDDTWAIQSLAAVSENQLVASFSKEQKPGLIVFTSSSTGEPKGILHDCHRVMRKFVNVRSKWRTILFLMLDHFGGLNTLFGTFAYGGTAVCLPDRLPLTVCRIIEETGATLLPTTPTFLNLLIASGSWKKHDTGTIQLITYGTEVMPEAMLAKIQPMFPKAKVKQTYGLSELGVLRSKSMDDGSTLVRIGGDGFETKVIDDILWVRSEANMVGYLNAPNPIDEDGWMCTEDQVEVKGDYIRFLGRTTDLINVGGQKVFPVEVESVLLDADNIAEATVYGIPHSLLGAAVAARISTDRAEDPDQIKRRLRAFCAERLAKYKIPMRFVLVDSGEQLSQRFKKIRRIEDE